MCCSVQSKASCQLSRHSCLFHQPLIKLEHCGTCSRPISHLHQVYFAGYCFTFSNSCLVRKTCGTLRMFTSAREPLLILFRGRRQGRQPLNIYIYTHNHRYITEEATTLQFRFGRLRSKRPKSQMYDGWLGLPASGTQSFQSPNSPKLPTSWYTK